MPFFVSKFLIFVKPSVLNSNMAVIEVRGGTSYDVVYVEPIINVFTTMKNIYGRSSRKKK